MKTQSAAQRPDTEGTDGEWNRRERKHDEIHPEENGDSADHAPEEEIFLEERISAAREAVGRCRAECDDEVQEESQTPNQSSASARGRNSLRAKQAARNTVRHARAESQKGGRAVDDAGGKPTRHYCGRDD